MITLAILTACGAAAIWGTLAAHRFIRDGRAMVLHFAAALERQ